MGIKRVKKIDTSAILVCYAKLTNSFSLDCKKNIESSSTHFFRSVSYPSAKASRSAHRTDLDFVHETPVCLLAKKRYLWGMQVRVKAFPGRATGILL